MVGISCGCSCPSVGASHVPQKSQLFSLWEVQSRCNPIDAAYPTAALGCAAVVADQIVLYQEVFQKRINIRVQIR